MGSKAQKNVIHTGAGDVVLHDGIRMPRNAEGDNLLQYKQTQFVNSMMLLRTLNEFFQDDGKCLIALDVSTGKLKMVDAIDPRKKHNKMFFDNAGKGVQIGSYKDGKFSPELEQFLKDNPEYINDPLIKHLTNCMDKKK